MSIDKDIQSLEPSAVIEMFVVDATAIGGGVNRFHTETNQVRQDLVWQGNTYATVPGESKGFEFTGTGPFPRPTLSLANRQGLIHALAREYDDLVGAVVYRKRTLRKYLDAINYPGGINPDADPTAQFDDDIFMVDRKVSANPLYVVFELAAGMDVQGVMLPGRQIVGNLCQWLSKGGYRGPYCGYTGGPVADAQDRPTSDPALDACGGRVKSCRYRFTELPHGGFPAAGLVKGV